MNVSSVTVVLLSVAVILQAVLSMKMQKRLDNLETLMAYQIQNGAFAKYVKKKRNGDGNRDAEK